MNPFSLDLYLYTVIYIQYIYTYIYIYYTYNWIITIPLKKIQVVPPGFRGRPSWAPRTHVTGSSSGRNRAPRFGVPGACHRNRFRSNDFTMDHDGSWWIRDSCRIFRTQDGGFCWSWSEIGNYFLELLYQMLINLDLCLLSGTQDIHLQISWLFDECFPSWGAIVPFNYYHWVHQRGWSRTASFALRPNDQQVPGCCHGPQRECILEGRRGLARGEHLGSRKNFHKRIWCCFL